MDDAVTGELAFRLESVSLSRRRAETGSVLARVTVLADVQIVLGMDVATYCKLCAFVSLCSESSTASIREDASIILHCQDVFLVGYEWVAGTPDWVRLVFMAALGALQETGVAVH